jgi:hypothetical protein
MNAISMQNLEEDKVLESQGLAAMTFTLNWSDGRATHEDEMHVEKFSVWREADILPADIGLKITGMHVGDRAQSALPGSCRRVERSSLETNPDQLSSLAHASVAGDGWS